VNVVSPCADETDLYAEQHQPSDEDGRMNVYHQGIGGPTACEVMNNVGHEPQQYHDPNYLYFLLVTMICPKAAYVKCAPGLRCTWGQLSATAPNVIKRMELHSWAAAA